jgi:hypothetical protein
VPVGYDGEVRNAAAFTGDVARRGATAPGEVELVRALAGASVHAPTAPAGAAERQPDERADDRRASTQVPTASAPLDLRRSSPPSRHGEA